MLQANFHQVQSAEHTCRNLTYSLSYSSFKHCSIFQPLEHTLPSPSDGWHACSRRCQLALDLTVRGTGYTYTLLHSLGDCIVVRMFCVFCLVNVVAFKEQNFHWFCDFNLVFADRRATARTTTFVEPCSIQKKKKPSPGYVIPDRSDDYCIPPLPCDLQVGELASSRRHVSTSLVASNGPVGEGDNPYSNVAIDEASVPVDDLQNHARTSSMLPNLTNGYLSIVSCFWSWWRSMPSEQSLSTKFPYLKARKIYISLISGSMLRRMSCKI